MKGIGIFGAYKNRTTLAGHELGNNLFEKEVLGDILSGQNNVLMDYGCSVDKRGQIF